MAVSAAALPSGKKQADTPAQRMNSKQHTTTPSPLRPATRTAHLITNHAMHTTPQPTQLHHSSPYFTTESLTHTTTRTTQLLLSTQLQQPIKRPKTTHTTPINLLPASKTLGSS